MDRGKQFSKNKQPNTCNIWDWTSMDNLQNHRVKNNLRMKQLEHLKASCFILKLFLQSSVLNNHPKLQPFLKQLK